MVVRINERTSDPILNLIAGHPTREQCWFILGERAASPKQMAAELGEEIPHVWYHVNKLKQAQAIEVVERRPVGNGNNVETFYRAIAPGFTADHTGVSKPKRESITMSIMRFIFANIFLAIRERTFDSRPDRVLVRAPGEVDDQGFSEAQRILDGAYEQIDQVYGESANRLAESGERPIPVTVITMLFERPPARS